MYIYININIYIYIKPLKPLKSEAIHETGLSGNVVTSFFPLIIYIYIYIYIHRPFSYLVIKENRQFLQHDKTVDVIPPQWNSPIDETLK